MLTVQAQVQESFSDGDFTQRPPWAGDAVSFHVNVTRQLQSQGAATSSGGTIYLSTPNTLAVNAQWEFFLRLDFATSSSNYAEVYLVSDVPDLKGALKGYFVRIGGQEDEVSLFRKDGATVTKIIDGPDRTLTAADNRLWVRVTRTATHDWTLELDLNATKQRYVVQGAVQDPRYLTSAYTGVLFRYTQTNVQRFHFDDFTVQETGVPSLISSKALGPKTVALTFSEPVLEKEAQNTSNYRINGSLIPIAAQWQAATPHVVHLQLPQELETGSHQVEVMRVADAEGNLAHNLVGTFSYSPVAAPSEVRVTEIFADVSPSQGLPAAEFIELYNSSQKTFDLQGWRYSDATASEGVFPGYLLRPGAYLIVSAAADTALFRPFGPVLGLATFPALNDSGDDVELFNAQGHLIDLVRFSNSWYQEAAKKEGGWSLELLDVNSRCAGASQWKASESAAGGTPGKPNSVQRVDQTAPVLQQAAPISANRVMLYFNEPLDSLAAVQEAKYLVSPAGAVQRVKITSRDLTVVELVLETPLRENERYVITAQGLKDCAGNTSASAQTAALVLPAPPQPGDVVINELLFNPRPGGVDFVEIVNRSPRYLDLQDWKIANRQQGKVANSRSLSTKNLLLPPGGYLVFTTDAGILQREYPAARAEKLVELVSLPSFPDEAGNAVLLLPNGEVMDELSYHQEQHFKLLADAEGVSLERITLAGPSTAANFHSAATNVFATPGYENSQAQEMLATTRKLSLQPKTFTPDGDGSDDALLLQFQLPQAGFVATVTIYDAQGRHVRKLSANTLLGAESVLQWDGLTDAGAKAAIGYYVVLVELFNLQGQKEVLKETAVVGGRF
ncbi:hypothetical protein GCM10011405_06600 [Rufibacter glacialis]|nr:hypothetical protein GCM10011405_06600 [Rufibacter glacialis]